MENLELFGQLASEKIAEENLKCRQIVQEINNFGVNERQKYFIIFLLSLELEDADVGREISALVREKREDTHLISE